MTDPSMLLGRAGGHWWELPRLPARDYDRTADAHAGVHDLLGGGYASDRAPVECRVWRLDWQWISDADRRILHALHTRQFGPGPFVLLDPASRNLLTPNVASGTDARRDTDGFTGTGVDELSSSATYSVTGARSLRWRLISPTETAAVLTLAPRTLSAWATPAGHPWSFTCSVRAGAGGATVVPQLRWLDSALAEVSISSGAGVAVSSSGWSTVTVTAAAPAGAAYVVPRLSVTTSAITGYLNDLFTRTVGAGSWGTPTVGAAYAIPLGTAANFSVNGNQGLVAINGVNAEQIAVTNVGTPDFRLRVDQLLAVTPATTAINMGAALRLSDASNYYWVDQQVEVTNLITLRLVKRVAGALSQVALIPTGLTNSTTVPQRLLAEISGDRIRARTWRSDGAEPTTWQLDMTDSSHATGNNFGVDVRLASGNTNGLPVTITVDNLFGQRPTDLYVSALSLQDTLTPGAWMPGEGQPLVSFSALGERVPWVERRDLSATLVEVG